jgi:hypothetical protein
MLAKGALFLQKGALRIGSGVACTWKRWPGSCGWLDHMGIGTQYARTRAKVLVCGV